MTISTGTKLLAGGALMVTGGGMVIAAGVAGFIAGASVAVWMEGQKEPRYRAYRPGPPPRPLRTATTPTEETSP